MKKFLLILCMPFLLMGCGTVESSELLSEIPETPTEKETTEITTTESEEWSVAVESEVFTVVTTEAVTVSPEDIEIPIWSPEHFQYEVTDTGLNVYKALNAMGERGELHQQLAVDIETLSDNIRDIVIPMDYDGDNYYDIAVRTYLGATNAAFRYFHYNPDTDYFEEWQELDKLNYFVSRMGDELTVFSKASAVDSEESVYKWSGDVLVLIRKEKQYMENENIFRDFLEYDNDGNETLTKRERLIYNDDNNLIDVITETY